MIKPARLGGESPLSGGMERSVHGQIVRLPLAAGHE